MSLLESFKIIGLLIVLALAGVALMLLSNFEFELRKDRIQYQTIWTQDFEVKALDSLWSTNDRDLGISISNGTLNLTPGQDNDNLQFKPLLPSDSMYLSIRLKWPDYENINASINIIQTGGKVIPLFSNSTRENQFVVLQTDKIMCESCHHLQFTMNRKNPSAKNALETQWQIDYISMSTFVTQEKLF